MFKLNIAFVGAGRIVDWFINDVKPSKCAKNIKLIGIWNHHLEKAITKQKKYHIAKVYQTFTHLIEDKKNYNLVYVGTADLHHYEYVKILLKNKINVFCEKPLTTSFSQTSELYKLAKQNNVLLFEGIKTGFSPIYVKVKSLLKEKVLGKICYVIASHAKVSTSQKVPNPPSNAKIAGFHRAGALYELFQVLDICGKVKTLTFMNNHYQHNTSAISTSVLNMRHQNGIISTAFGSDEFSDDLSTKICGTKGVIILGGNIKKYHQDYHKDSSHFAYSYRWFDNQQHLVKEETMVVKTVGEGLVKEIEHVYELMKDHKKTSPIVTPKISMQIAKIIDCSNEVNDQKVINLK